MGDVIVFASYFLAAPSQYGKAEERMEGEVGTLSTKYGVELC
jgi:hypothetical protein